MDKATGKKMDEKTIQSFKIIVGTDKPFLYHCKSFFSFHSDSIYKKIEFVHLYLF